MNRIIGAMIICSCTWSTIYGQVQKNHILELKQKLEKSKNDSTRVLLLIDIASNFINEPDSDIFYNLKALALAREIEFHKGELRAILGVEITMRHNGNEIKAFSAASKGVKLAAQYDDSNFRAHFLGELGIIYMESGGYEKALANLRESKNLFDSIRNFELSAYQLNNIGEVYFRKGELDSALFYCKTAFDAFTPGNIWIDYYSSLNLGRIYSERGDFELALQYAKMSHRLALFFSHKFNSILLIAKTYQYLNEPDSSLLYASKALAIAQESNIFYQIVDANTFIAAYYEKSEPNKSLEYLHIASNYKDSLYRYNEKLTIESFDEFDVQERQNEIQQARSQYQYKVRQYAFLSGAGVLIVIAIILFHSNRQKQKANLVLQKQKEEISTQREMAEKTLIDLKSTQSQLIQSEKMASLGELTAGIAHEIQNPLNFVNNFSEVNKELLLEMNDEITKGNFNDVKEIAKSVIDNEEKIIFHGKRADGIVKGMLQHSRSSSGVKEPTDINALADEYLRLAYHGLRAKDKSFNATMKTDYDDGIDSINVVPQDIGRVILNLITNAFYAVTLRHSLPAEAVAQAGKGDESYQPTVWVSTQKVQDKILISVKDNGLGIPDSIKDKIFQPFFTTKPTGQGTGLGLSLSYDIVKAHGGELSVATQEGAGSEFVISMPI